MELIQAIRSRRSVREYADTPVDEELIRFVIEAATQAPNAMNRQAWTFAVATDRRRLQRWSEQAKRRMLDVMVGDTRIHGYRERLASPSFNVFCDAPALIVIGTSATDVMGAQDCCLAAQNLMLAAHSRGLGTCWIGLAEAWLSLAETRRELGLTDDQVAVAPIILGYARRAPDPVPREPPRILWVDELEPVLEPQR